MKKHPPPSKTTVLRRMKKIDRGYSILAVVVGLSYLLALFFVRWRHDGAEKTLQEETGEGVYTFTGPEGEQSWALCAPSEHLLSGSCTGTGKILSSPTKQLGRLGWSCRSTETAKAQARCLGERRPWALASLTMATSWALAEEQLSPKREISFDWYTIRNALDGCLDSLEPIDTP